MRLCQHLPWTMASGTCPLDIDTHTPSEKWLFHSTPLALLGHRTEIPLHLLHSRRKRSMQQTCLVLPLLVRPASAVSRCRLVPGLAELQATALQQPAAARVPPLRPRHPEHPEVSASKNLTLHGHRVLASMSHFVLSLRLTLLSFFHDRDRILLASVVREAAFRSHPAVPLCCCDSPASRCTH